MLMVVLVLCILSYVSTVSGFSCEEGVSNLSPCGSFVTGSTPKPGTECCNRVQETNQMIKKMEYRHVCQCFNDKTKTVPAVNLEKAVKLPSLCNITGNIPIEKCKRLVYPKPWKFMQSKMFWIMIVLVAAVAVYYLVKETIHMRDQQRRRKRYQPLPLEIRDSISSFVFLSAEDTPVSQSCTICLHDYQSPQRVTVLPSCLHAFHTVCINGWLDVASTCPNCRLPIGLERLPIDEDI